MRRGPNLKNVPESPRQGGSVNLFSYDLSGVQQSIFSEKLRNHVTLNLRGQQAREIANQSAPTRQIGLCRLAKPRSNKNQDSPVSDFSYKRVGPHRLEDLPSNGVSQIANNAFISGRLVKLTSD